MIRLVRKRLSLQFPFMNNDLIAILQVAPHFSRMFSSVSLIANVYSFTKLFLRTHRTILHHAAPPCFITGYANNI